MNTHNLPEYDATSYDLYQDSYSPHYSPRSDDNVTLPIHLPCQKVDNEEVVAPPPSLPIATSTQQGGYDKVRSCVINLHSSLHKYMYIHIVHDLHRILRYISTYTYM